MKHNFFWFWNKIWLISSSGYPSIVVKKKKKCCYIQCRDLYLLLGLTSNLTISQIQLDSTLSFGRLCFQWKHYLLRCYRQFSTSSIWEPIHEHRECQSRRRKKVSQASLIHTRISNGEKPLLSWAKFEKAPASCSVSTLHRTCNEDGVNSSFKQATEEK